MKKKEHRVAIVIFFGTILLLSFFLFALPLPEVFFSGLSKSSNPDKLTIDALRMEHPPLYSAPLWLFGTLYVLLGFIEGSPNGVLMELAVEMTFPLSETYVGIASILGINVIYTLILYLFSYFYLPWYQIIYYLFLFLSIIFILLFTPNHKRLAVEEKGGAMMNDEESV